MGSGTDTLLLRAVRFPGAGLKHTEHSSHSKNSLKGLAEVSARADREDTGCDSALRVGAFILKA